MKQVLREAGIPTAASAGVDSADEARAFARGGGLSVDPEAALRRGRGRHHPSRFRHRAGGGVGVVRRDGRRRSRSRSSSRVTKGFYDTLSIDGCVRTSSSSRTTSRACSRRCGPGGSRRSSSRPTGWTAPADYDELKELGRRVNEALGHRHLGHPHGMVLRAQGSALLRDRLPSVRGRRLGPVRAGQRHRHLPRVGPRRRPRVDDHRGRAVATPPA